MPTAARIGLGTEFHLEATAGGVLTKLGEITGITTPSVTIDEVDATSFDSEGGFREYITGLRDGGTGEFTMNYVPGSATDTLISAAIADGAARGYMIVIPNGGAGWEVTGNLVVLSYTKDVPIDDRMTATLGVRFTGQSAEAAGS